MNTQSSKNIIYGKNPVFEALSKNPKRVNKIYIQKNFSLDNRLKKIYELAHAKQTKFVLGIGFNRGCSWLPSLLPLLMKENEDIDLQIAEASDQQLETGIQKNYQRQSAGCRYTWWWHRGAHGFCGSSAPVPNR